VNTFVTGGDLPGLKALMERMKDANRSVLVGVPAGEFEEGGHRRSAKAMNSFVSSRMKVAGQRAKAAAQREFMATDEEVEEGPLRSIFLKHRSQAIQKSVETARKNFNGSQAADTIPMAMIAAVHEFGSPEHGIPERSFLRGGIRRGIPKFQRLNILNLRCVLLGSKTIEQAIGQLGAVAAGEVKREFTAGTFAPNRPATIARKGSSRPLIDSGSLRQSITWVVEGEQSANARVIR
jgi:hypothetical protein